MLRVQIVFHLFVFGKYFARNVQGLLGCFCLLPMKDPFLEILVQATEKEKPKTELGFGHKS